MCVLFYLRSTAHSLGLFLSCQHHFFVSSGECKLRAEFKNLERISSGGAWWGCHRNQEADACSAGWSRGASLTRLSPHRSSEPLPFRRNPLHGHRVFPELSLWCPQLVRLLHGKSHRRVSAWLSPQFQMWAAGRWEVSLVISKCVFLNIFCDYRDLETQIWQAT